MLKFHLLSKEKIKSVNVKVGDKISEGDTILILENSEIIEEDIKEQPKVENGEAKSQNKKETIVNDVPKQDFVEKNISGVSAASPKVRKFARELGVDINQINGSKRLGRVVESDVKSFISSKINKTFDSDINYQKKLKLSFLIQILEKLRLRICQELKNWHQLI